MREVTGPVRQTIEFFIVLTLSILLFRTFAAEAYIVPTGSMAPTLLGRHRELTCPNCRYRFPIGMDEEGRSGRPACPNCGKGRLEDEPAVECNGDRLLVQKFFFEMRGPKRWEVAVFRYPGDLSQAFVKRVVALPGEVLQIVRGDVHIDGTVARKTLKEQRAMRVLVYDHDYKPDDFGRYPRWTFRRATSILRSPTGWSFDGNKFFHEPDADAQETLAKGRPAPVDWLEYHHWLPERGGYGPVRDYCGYNGVDMNSSNTVRDFFLEATIEAEPGVEAILARFVSGSDHFVIVIPLGGPAPPEVRRNGILLRPQGLRPDLARSLATSGPIKLEASVIDQRFTVALNDQLLFTPYDYDDPSDKPPRIDESPVALGIRGGRAIASGLKIYRDFHYTSDIIDAARHPAGVERPLQLKAGEYFVLGDNSPVSNDSRFWTVGPIVKREMFIGKPFLVHLPGQVVPLEVFGHSLYCIPDPREIRYIR